jgi:hypothetical protein
MDNNFIPMGFGLCKCRSCRKIWKDNLGRWNKHHKHKERAYKYRLIIKRIRRNKHKEDLERTTFNVGSYTD